MKSQERPFPITLICLLGFAACSLGMILVYSPTVIQAGKVYAIYRSLGFSCLAFCFAGLWMMRRWGVWAFGAYFILNQIVCWAFDKWDWNTMGPLLPLAVALAYYRRMK